MEYHEAVNALERLRRLRPKLGTETTASLLEFLGAPHEGVPAVQVAGSNGKGSTARILERVLREAGLEVGLYTSPDLNDLRERVRVGDRKIGKAEVVRFVEEAWPYVLERDVEGDAPTFFEAFTALALWHFGRENVDVAVLEVGIGGRYDATSVVDPVASAVTSVSLEHTDLLGETVEEIARDKAHVAPGDVPLVTGATGAALETIRERTDVLTVGGGRRTPGGEGDDGAASDPDPDDRPDVVATEREMVSSAESALSLAGPDWSVETRTPLLGAHQAVNAGVAAALARQVGAATGTAVTEADIAAGIRNVRWPGRFEVMGEDPLVVLDGAHNPDACAKLATLLDRFEYDDLHLVFGAMRDKDHAEMCRALPPVDRAYLAEPAVDRALGVDTLAAVFERETAAGTDGYGTVLDAVEGALEGARESDCVLVAGSLYTVGEARDRWTRAPRVVETDTPARARAAMRRADVPEKVREARADRTVGRTVRFHARRGDAADLTELMLSLGGTAATSGITTADEHVEVVLNGSLPAFRRLVARLEDGSGGKARIAAQVANALGIRGGSTDGDDRGTERGGSSYPWDDGTAVMGVLDPAPGSTDDGEKRAAVADAVERAREMVEAGADAIDVVGRSARPGVGAVPSAEERDRVVEVIEALEGVGTTVSVSTRRPPVAGAALDAGADLIRDPESLADAGMRRLVADRDVPVVLAYAPDGSTDRRVGDDTVGDAFEEVNERLLLAERVGIDRSRVVVAPGTGIGGRAPSGFEVLDRLPEFHGLGTPIGLGHGDARAFDERGRGSDAADAADASAAAVTALAVERGVDLVRTRDVPGAVAAVAAAESTVRNE